MKLQKLNLLFFCSMVMVGLQGVAHTRQHTVDGGECCAFLGGLRGLRAIGMSRELWLREGKGQGNDADSIMAMVVDC